MDESERVYEAYRTEKDYAGDAPIPTTTGK